jgi:hypothetical protein
VTLEFSRIVITTPLVTLIEAKLQLHIADTVHDQDITAQRDAAQDAIVAYLGAAADAAWNDVTVPRPVKQAIKLLMTHYYEHRGDAMETTDPAIWQAIYALLAMYRDPTLVA